MDTQCFLGKLITCNSVTNNFHGCDSFLPGSSTIEQCFVSQDPQFDHITLNETFIEFYISETNTIISICELTTFSSVADDMYHQTASLSDYASATTTPFAKTVHATASIHFTISDPSPSILQSSSPSPAAVIGGVVVGVAILITATVLLLAIFCVIKAVKRSKCITGL